MPQTKTETWRVFCAIELPSLAIEKISEHIKRLRAAAPDSPASWSRAENVHLTLKFIGEIPQNRVSDLSQAVANAVAGFSPFELEIKDTGSFPKHGTPRVFWIGIDDGSGQLAQLQAKLDEECLLLGFEKEARPFNPHLTIARGRKPQGARALATAHEKMGFLATKIRVKELSVIRSELSSKGSNYTTISRHTLTNKETTRPGLPR
ncbi:MAG TPA: RNA 2',3'-cyclic phosphodiesterase [Pyrinomonadaceae bacterium]|nr:RNA 2',3'-cyclic phosphodiesterase [Pyrinomonadaceae bacterium]